MTLASPNRRSEDVRILSVVVAELKFRDIERHIFATDLVETADDAALKDRPEALDCLGVNSADNVLALGVVDDGVRIFAIEVFISDH